MIPSSKIETRDLSPQVLGGVAQEESVQEVLNKLDNVAQQEDMQEILGKIESVQRSTNGKSLSVVSGQSTITKSASGQTLKLVSVTGKGSFCFASTHITRLGNSAVQHHLLKVTVDGVCIANLRRMYTDTVSSSDIGVSSRKWLFATSSTRCNVPTQAGSGGPIVSVQGIIYESSAEQQGPSTYTGDGYNGAPMSILFTEDIQFNSSLEIELSYGNNAATNLESTYTYSVGYVLE